MFALEESMPSNNFQLNEYIDYLCQISGLRESSNVAYVESLIYFPKNDLRPHANVRVNGNSINGLLDTGSHVTVIGKNLYEAFNWGTELVKFDSSIITFRV